MGRRHQRGALQRLGPCRDSSACTSHELMMLRDCSSIFWTLTAHLTECSWQMSLCLITDQRRTFWAITVTIC